MGGLKIDTCAGIAERRAPSWLVGIVVIEAERGLAAFLAAYVAATARFVGGAGTLAFNGDAPGRRLFPREVRDRRTGVIIRVGNVDHMIRVHPNQEGVRETPPGRDRRSSS